MNLDEVADKFALDTVFHDYPVDGTVVALEQIANACETFFEHDEWTFAEEYEPYAYISAGAILQLVYDKAWQFKRYYEMVGE